MSKIAIVVEFDVKDGCLEAFLKHIRAHAQTSLDTEPGCERFDVMTPTNGDNKVFLCEVYRNMAAFEFHRNQPRMADVAAGSKDLLNGRKLNICNI